MNDQEKRIRIAELCGWIHYPNGDNDHCALSKKHPWFNPSDGSCYYNCPDYLNDLNAMHAAEKTMSVRQHREFTEVLSNSVLDYQSADYSINRSLLYYLIHATALQRANAFLEVCHVS